MKPIFLCICMFYFIACHKQGASPETRVASQSPNITDPRIGTLMKWKCIGGDTIFNDTLIMKLQTITINLQNKEELFYSFNKPIWSYTNFKCISDDLPYLNNITFTGPDCKSATFFKIN